MPELQGGLGKDELPIPVPEEDIIGGFILGDIDFINWVKDSFLSARNDE